MALGNHENQLFQAELEKFRPHQNRLLSTVHKQSSLLKDLTKIYGDLLQDKRVRADRDKHENITRSRSTVMNKYRRTFGAFEDLTQGLIRAQNFYSEMTDSVESLHKNVEGFVNNRRAEGAQLLNHIEQNKSNNAGSQANAERERLQQLMERMSMEPSTSPSKAQPSATTSIPTNNYSRSPPISPQYRTTNPDPRFTIPPRDSPQPPIPPQQDYHSQTPATHDYQQPQHSAYPPSAHPFSQGAAAPLSEGYNPMAYPYPTASPQPYFSPSPAPNPYFQPHHQAQQPQPPPPQSQQQPQIPQRPPSTTQQQPQSTPQQPSTSPSPFQPLTFRQPSNYGYQAPPPTTNHHHQQPYPPQQQPPQMPGSYVPPPPPPGPPPGQAQTQYPPSAGPWPSGPGGYANVPPRPSPGGGSGSAGGVGGPKQAQAQGADPFDGLSGWK